MRYLCLALIGFVFVDGFSPTLLVRHSLSTLGNLMRPQSKFVSLRKAHSQVKMQVCRG